MPRERGGECGISVRSEETAIFVAKPVDSEDEPKKVFVE
jgi:hypothetical protein